MLITLLVSAGVTIHCLRFRRERSISGFLWLTASAAVWSCDVIAEFLSSDFSLKYVLALLKPFAVMSTASALFVLMAQRTSLWVLPRRIYVGLLLIVPVITAALSLHPGSQHFYRFDFHLRAHGAATAMTWDHGPWQIVLYVYYYALAFLAAAIGIHLSLASGKRGRTWFLLMTGSWVVPFVLDLTGKLMDIPQTVDMPAWGLCIASLVSGWAVLVARVLDAGPVARSFVVEGMDDLLFVFNLQDRLVDFNRHAIEALGLSREECLDLTSDTIPRPWRAVLRSGGQLRGPQLRVNGPDGAPRIFEKTETVLRNHGKSEIGRMVMLHDITSLEKFKDLLSEKNSQLEATNETLRAEAEHRRAAEERLVHAERMEAIGMLAGGIAHDFNNLLTVINGYSAQLRERLSADSALRKPAEEIWRAGESAANLTHQLLAFSRKQVRLPKPLDINAEITELKDILQRLVGQNIELRTELGDLSGTVLADSHQLHQILMNLAANARDAMPHGGVLLIETGNCHLTVETAKEFTEVDPGDYLQIQITDTGSGMSDEVRGRVFEPFFTTKPKGHGTGLGLSTVYGVVRQNGGAISVASELGIGTTFRIILPRTNRASELRQPVTSGIKPGNERILLVEDHAGVREFAKEALETFGYTVLTASGPWDALQLASRPDARVNLILTDVIMPDISGPKLVSQLRRFLPGARVLFMSGHSEDEIGGAEPLPADQAFIEKPFSPDDLARTVRSVMDRTSDVVGANPGTPI